MGQFAYWIYLEAFVLLSRQRMLRQYLQNFLQNDGCLQSHIRWIRLSYSLFVRKRTHYYLHFIPFRYLNAYYVPSCGFHHD